ncbi:LOW QUALITY PROTEIN: hypothetical protein Cgig2_029587 [Carnegiea gigantea]|uniref:Uncharacterized protein n=1 Tax=Carnegiea gigantea TaxID=171969 RepID=A0A9Q1JYE6_9CARY|nr:LOW QUALITY PROTEIN: hypothetical protein Cgig2_029587 [Carnegiea gigantea]
MQCTADELPDLRRKSIPRGLNVKPLNDDGPQSVVLTTNAREAPLGRRMACDLESILMEVRDHPMLKKPPSMTSAPKLHNAQKYCGFHEQNGHTTAECWELRKALHELVKARNLEVRLLVVDVLTAYNVILGWPSLRRVKAIIASDLLHLQFKPDNGRVGMMEISEQLANATLSAFDP